MSQALYGGPISGSSPMRAPSLSSVVNLRLALGLSVLAGALIFFFGVSLDLQWHSYVGRDRTLIPPHEMMLFGVIVIGLAALALVLVETLWTRRNPTLARYSTSFAGGFSAPLGAYLAGFGALDTAFGFVLDSYWHALYGVDTPILAPFHVMLLVGVMISGLGAAYLLAGSAALASRAGAPGKARIGYIATAAALSSIMTMLALLTIETVMGDDNRGGSISLFPLLVGLGCSWLLVAASSTIPWRWAASLVAGITILLILLMAAFVPTAMDFLMALEHLSYRDIPTHRFGPHLAQLAILWPLTTAFIAAFLLDLCMAKAQRKGWSPRRLTLTLLLALFPVCLPVMPIFPISFILIFLPNPLAGVLALVLGLLGILGGIWLGHNTGKAMQAGR